MSEWTPEFEGQRPPFEAGNVPSNAFPPGNDLPVTHGGYSPRKVDPLATELVDGLLADPGLEYLKAPAYQPAVWAWARAEASVQLVTEWLAVKAEASGDGVGDLDSEAVRAAYLLLHRAEARATTGRTRLGLDPLSRARLGKDVAQGALANDLATTMAALERREREARELMAREAGES